MAIALYEERRGRANGDNQIKIATAKKCMAHGWFLTTSPVITADWLAAPGQQWTVPIGGGLGRVFKLGDQPMSAYISAYYNAIRPDAAPTWQLRAELSLLFPER